MIELIKNNIQAIQENKWLPSSDIEKAQQVFEQRTHVILSHGKEKITIMIEGEEEDFVVEIIAKNATELLQKVNGSFEE